MAQKAKMSPLLRIFKIGYRPVNIGMNQYVSLSALSSQFVEGGLIA